MAASRILFYSRTGIVSQSQSGLSHGLSFILHQVQHLFCLNSLMKTFSFKTEAPFVVATNDVPYEQTMSQEDKNKLDNQQTDDDDEWDDFKSSIQFVSNNEQQEQVIKHQFDLNDYDVRFESELLRLAGNTTDDYLAEEYEYKGAYVNNNIEDLWCQLIDVDDCDLLRFQYKNSLIENILYDALGIDRTPQGKLVSSFCSFFDSFFDNFNCHWL